MDYRRILVIRFHMIGDVFLTGPLMQILRRKFPDCNLTLMTDGPAAELMEGHPALDEVIVYNSYFGAQKLTLRDITRHWTMFRLVTSKEFDLVINLQPGIRGENVSRWSYAQTRVGYERHGLRDSTYTVTVPEDWKPPYRAAHMLNTLRAIGIDEPVELPKIGLSKENREVVLSHIGADPRPIVVLHPGRQNTNKAWVFDRFSELGRELISRYGVRLAFIGAASEKAQTEEIISGIGGPCLSLAGELNLKEVGALIEVSRLFIGVDSCPLHIASAVGTPTVCLFGPSEPRIWNPPGEKHVVIRKQIGPEPCGEPHCGPSQSKCLAGITAADVLSAVESHHFL